MSNTFRKKLNHYEREGVEATTKLAMVEPELQKAETELIKLKTEIKEWFKYSDDSKMYSCAKK